MSSSFGLKDTVIIHIFWAIGWSARDFELMSFMHLCVVFIHQFVPECLNFCIYNIPNDLSGKSTNNLMGTIDCVV